MEFTDEEHDLVSTASEQVGIFLAPVLRMREECLLCVDEQDTQYVVGRLDDGEPFALETEHPVDLRKHT